MDLESVGAFGFDEGGLSVEGGCGGILTVWWWLVATGGKVSVFFKFGERASESLREFENLIS